jgi:hypothetical protein
MILYHFTIKPYMVKLNVRIELEELIHLIVIKEEMENNVPNVDIVENAPSPASTVLLTPTSPETSSDSEGYRQTNATHMSRNQIREWNSFTRSLVNNDLAVLDNVELTSRYIGRMIKTLKQYPYTVQYKIITYILRPDHPPIYSRHSRWMDEDIREHSYWVTCEVLDLIGRTRENHIIEEQINCALALIRMGSMSNTDLDMIIPHFTTSLYNLRSTGYLWCKTLIAFMLGMDRTTWEGPLRNHIRNNLTDFHIATFLRAIHRNNGITINDDKYITMLFKWLGGEMKREGEIESEESMPRAFLMDV